MVDILANGDFGRDEGIKCNLECQIKTPFGTETRICGGKTFLVDNQGDGLKAYECEACGETFQVQFEVDDPEEYEPDIEYDGLYDWTW